MFVKPSKQRSDVEWYGKFVVVDDDPDKIKQAAEYVTDDLVRNVAGAVRDNAEVIVHHLESGQATVGVKICVFKEGAGGKIPDRPNRKDLIEKCFVSKDCGAYSH